jgi:hypothetical protein
MRPRDFPERKNRRRKAALARLGSRSASGAPDERAEYMRLLEQETVALYERIVPSAFHVVTRKIGGNDVLNRPRRQPKAMA